MTNNYTTPSTYKGLTALLLWSTSASVVCTLSSIPSLELLTLSFALASFYTLARLIIRNEWKTLMVSWKTWGLVLMGVVLQQFLYIHAFCSAKPAEVDLIIYLWPSIGVILSTLYFQEKIRIYHIISVLFGTLAIISLTSDQASFNEFTWGHVFAFTCAVTWASYSVFTRNIESIHPNIIGVAYFIGLFVVAPLHLNHEQFIVPSFSESLIIIYFATCCTLAAFALWTDGMQGGRPRYLMLTAYFKPVASLSLLCIFGLAEPTIQLALACLFVFLAGATTNIVTFPQTAEYIKDISLRSLKSLIT